eukprot:3514000-Pleurochrysis_carterae.AAC.2
MDGATPLRAVLVVGATNRPHALDEALRRRTTHTRAPARARPDDPPNLLSRGTLSTTPTSPPMPSLSA